ncbi:Spy/CpxP family protein refolding chaperone [Thermodesulfobacteriota bacterium]
MKQKKIFILTLVIALIAAFSMSAVAKGPGWHHRHGSLNRLMGMRFFLELKLSDAQQSKMLKIMDKYKEEKESLRELMRKARANMRDVMHSEKLDEDALRKAYRESSSVKEDIFLLAARMRAELKTVLTPEQLKIIKERRSKFHKYRGKRPVVKTEEHAN